VSRVTELTAHLSESRHVPTAALCAPAILDHELEYRGFLSSAIDCRACGWRGTGHELKVGSDSRHSGHGDFHCPSCAQYIRTVPFPQLRKEPIWQPGSVLARIEQSFPEGTTFHVSDGIPYQLISSWDWALRWDTDPPLEVDCTLPPAARLIGEAEFRLLVLKTHGLVE
jgi:hypothetical protein